MTGKRPGEKIGKPTPEQAEIARLTRELDLSRRQLSKTEAALQIMGKVHALGGDLRERGHAEQARKALTAGYDELVGIGTSTRDAAALTGLVRATQDRRRSTASVTPRDLMPQAAPRNKLTDEDELQVLAVVNSPRFVDKPPKQIYATLLAEPGSTA